MEKTYLLDIITYTEARQNNNNYYVKILNGFLRGGLRI